MTTNDGSLHCLGNGRFCAYEQGADILQLFGPPYSAPGLGRLTVDAPAPIETQSMREPGTAIWTHTFPGVGMTDFVDARLPCLIRRVRASTPLRLRLEANPSARIVFSPAAPAGKASGITLEISAGAYFYMHYPFPRLVFYRVSWKGAVSIEPASGNQIPIVCQPGECWLYFTGGPEYPQAVENSEAVLAESGEECLARTRAAWRSFTAARADWAAQLPQGAPQRDRLLKAIDDVAVLIKTQQSKEGGVLAGHNYHMAYVRDQYGVARGLLAMGHLAEARAILQFYWDIWQRHGVIHNGQAVGVEGAFHIHENDEVEITGYLVRQAFDLLDRSGDTAFIQEIFPMLAWAFDAQKRNLIQGMLPFNGDETYIAGGILPRTALNDGSAEATLLFVDGGERLATWAAGQGLWNGEKLDAARQSLVEVGVAYRGNFLVGGRLTTNNPARAALPGSCPRFRHGVCERCMAEGRFQAIGWTERSQTGRYLCPHCLAEGDYAPSTLRRYDIQSVSLTPLYFQSRLLEKDDLRPMVRSILDSYRATGRLPSRPDDERGISVGYDYGFLLYALVELNEPGVVEIYEKILALADASGAWVEYYVNHMPSGTRYRPWESAINLEALLHAFQI